MSLLMDDDPVFNILKLFSDGCLLLLNPMNF